MVRRIAAAVAVATLLLAACGDDDDASPVPTTEVDPRDDPTQQPVEEEAAAGLPTPDCAAAFAEASPGEVSSFDAAAEVCISLADWLAADAGNPDALAGEDPRVFAENVCERSAVADAPLCQELRG